MKINYTFLASNSHVESYDHHQNCSFRCFTRRGGEIFFANGSHLEWRGELRLVQPCQLDSFRSAGRAKHYQFQEKVSSGTSSDL